MMQATGFSLNPYHGSSDPRFSRYANGILWVNELGAYRTTLLDPEGATLAVLGPRSINETGAVAYDECPSDSLFRSLEPTGSPVFDPHDNLLLADEGNHRVSIHALSAYGQSGCPPDPTGGLFPGSDPNVSYWDDQVSAAFQAALAGYQPAIATQVGETAGLGMVVYDSPDGDPGKDQLIVLGDDSRLKVWNDYTHAVPGAPPSFVLEGVETVIFGQANEVTAGGSSYLLLWVNTNPPLAAYSLPLTEASSPVALGLEWNGQTTIGPIFGSIAYDAAKLRLYLADPDNNRILRVSNVSDFHSPGQTLTVDAIIGQTATTNSSPNHGAATPQPDGLSMWFNNELKFDAQGNLFVVENDYEGHGNVRIVMLAAANLDRVTTPCADSATVLCALVPAAKAFVGTLTTAGPMAYGTVGEPGSPISLTFDVAGEMVVSNDGYYGDESLRPWRQLWLYHDPLRRESDGSYTVGQQPDFAISVPMGAPGEVTFDSHGLLLVQDHTWDRVLGIDLARDPWLVPTVSGCYLLTTAASPPAGGSVQVNTPHNCGGGFQTGTVVSLTAVPLPGYAFSSWSGSGGSFSSESSPATTFTTAGSASVTANFASRPAQTLTVTLAGTGSGAVTSSPTGINCGGTCWTSFPYNTVVTLTATPVGGSALTGWSGGGCSGTGTCQVTASQAQSVTATFTKGAKFYPVTPCRLVDTRHGPKDVLQPGGSTPSGFPRGSYADGEIRSYDLTSSGACSGLPAGVTAWSLLFQFTTSASPAYLQAWPYISVGGIGSQAPPTSESTMLGYTDRWTANSAIIPGGDDGNGSINVLAQHAGDVIIEVNGYFK